MQLKGLTAIKVQRPTKEARLRLIHSQGVFLFSLKEAKMSGSEERITVGYISIYAVCFVRNRSCSYSSLGPGTIMPVTYAKGIGMNCYRRLA